MYWSERDTRNSMLRTREARVVQKRRVRPRHVEGLANAVRAGRRRQALYLNHSTGGDGHVWLEIQGERVERRRHVGFFDNGTPNPLRRA
jgi:hypothetical protein